MNLDHRITINRFTESVNAYNESVQVFAPYITISAGRRDASAGETYKAQEIGAEITVRFTVRFSPESATITPKDTVTLEGGKTYNITQVRETQRNHWLEIDCVTRADK